MKGKNFWLHAIFAFAAILIFAGLISEFSPNKKGEFVMSLVPASREEIKPVSRQAIAEHVRYLQKRENAFGMSAFGIQIDASMQKQILQMISMYSEDASPIKLEINSANNSSYANLSDDEITELAQAAKTILLFAVVFYFVSIILSILFFLLLYRKNLLLAKYAILYVILFLLIAATGFSFFLIFFAPFFSSRCPKCKYPLSRAEAKKKECPKCRNFSVAAPKQV